MRKLKTAMLALAVLVITMAPMVALAEFDFSGMTDDEILNLIDEANEELNRRNLGGLDGSVDVEAFSNAVDTMRVFLEWEPDYSNVKRTAVDEHYFVSCVDGIRILLSDEKVIKVSAAFGDDGENVVKRMFLVSSIFEEKLFDKEYISTNDKRNAFDAADKIVNTAFDHSDNLKKVILSGKEGDKELAATGEYVYYWEYLDDSLWLSVELTEIPEGIY